MAVRIRQPMARISFPVPEVKVETKDFPTI